LPKITQLRSGSTVSFDKMRKITQLRCRKKRHMLKVACDQRDQKWTQRAQATCLRSHSSEGKHREVRQLA